MVRNKKFEAWFLRLNPDFDKDELSKTRAGRYFFTTTQAMWEQWETISEFGAKLSKAEAHARVETCQAVEQVLLDMTPDDALDKAIKEIRRIEKGYVKDRDETVSQNPAKTEHPSFLLR